MTLKEVVKPDEPEWNFMRDQKPFELREFSSHVMSRDWQGVEEMNDNLKLEAWKQRALDPQGLYRSNVAGTWHSSDNCLPKMGEAGLQLRRMFSVAMAEWAGVIGLKEAIDIHTIAWIMIYSDRGYATVHTHPNCHVSAVYYVDDTTQADNITMATGVTVKPGDIEFINPLQRDYQLPSMILNPSMIFSHKPGRMVVFPSNLPHFVHPIKGPGERIAIACNGTFRPLPKEKK